MKLAILYDAGKTETTIASLAALTKSDGTLATLKVEAYGIRERQELQANVFARELLIPREVAKTLWQLGKSPIVIARDLEIPLEIVRQQMLDALLLPSAPETLPSPQKTPSPDQVAAATAIERYVNVVAGPGTGKTTTLIERIKHLVEAKKVPANKILVLTFTNKAAFELVERLRDSGVNSASEIWAGTFHAFGLEFFRKYHHLFSLDSDVAVADTLQEVALLVKRLPQIELKFYKRLQDPYDWLKEVVDCIHRLKEELIDPDLFKSRVQMFPSESEEIRKQREDVANLYFALEEALKEARMVSMSDLVMQTAIKLRDEREKVGQIASHFEHILVDEYQDVSEAMVVLVRQLSIAAHSLWVVGDVRQAIHHWRGASVKSLLRFEQSFRSDSSQSARKYPLDSNRRSSTEVAALFDHAGKVHVLETLLPLDKLVAIKGASTVIPELVSCTTKSSIGYAIRDRINIDKAAGIAYKDQAVLCRRTQDVEFLAKFLRDSGVPVFFVGDVMRRNEVKRILCLMQLLAEREPKALIGLAGDGKISLSLADIQVLINRAKSDREFQRGRWLGKVLDGISPAGAIAANNLATLLKGFSRSSNPWNFLCHLLLELRYGLPAEDDHTIEAQTQRIALWQFAYSVRNGDGGGLRMNLSRYLARQQLRQRVGETYGDRQLPAEANFMNAVRIMTVHGSKGLEFESVHLGYVDGGSYGAAKPSWSFPSTIEEVLTPEILGSTPTEYEFESAVERNNLLYVALSRARTRLHLYESVEFGTKGRPPQLQSVPASICRTNVFVLPQINQVAQPLVPNSSAVAVKFEEFEAYVRCPRQYYYRYKLALAPELDFDVSTRARRAINQTLVACAKGENAQISFDNAWGVNKLPSYAEDPGLFNDAVLTCNKGLGVLGSLDGYVIESVQARLAGINIKLPWILHSPKAGNHIFRFSSIDAAKTVSLLRPLLLDTTSLPQAPMTLNTLLTPKQFDIVASKAPEKTDAYKASLKMLSGDFSPNRGGTCGRCAFSTICID